MAAKKKDAPREVVTSLSQIGARKINVEIEDIDGTILEIPMRTLSYGEFQRVGRDVVDPTPPVLMAGPGGTTYDFKNPAYLEALEHAKTKRMALRLVHCLEIEVEGNSLDAKADALLEGISTQAFYTLIAAMNRAHTERGARVEARAERFPQ